MHRPVVLLEGEHGAGDRKLDHRRVSEPHRLAAGTKFDERERERESTKFVDESFIGLGLVTNYMILYQLGFMIR